MKTQKTVTSLLAALLSIALLAGCGGNADENRDVKGETTQTTQQDESRDENTTQTAQPKESATKYTAESGPLTDTLSWFNGTYAVITTLNGGDLNLVAGFKPGEMIREPMQAMLERDWGVTDRASMDETIDWLLTEGHNADAWSVLIGFQEMSREDLIEFMEEDGYGEREQIYNLASYDAL